MPRFSSSMPTSETLAAQLARCVDRFRDAGAKEEQKAEFRALMGLLETDPLIVREDGGRVTVNGSPVDRAAVTSLADGMTVQMIAEKLDLANGTVRNDLKRAFDKTDAQSQVALLAVLRNFGLRRSL